MTDARAASGEMTVELTDEFTFVPDRLATRVGQTVTWRNSGSAIHTVTGDPNKAADKNHARLPAGATAWDSGTLAGGQTFTRTFDVPGEYVYFCIPHEVLGMVGTLVVSA